MEDISANVYICYNNITDRINTVNCCKEELFESYYKASFSKLCYYAYQYVLDNETAEDIVQSFFVSLWEKKDELEIDRSLNSYCYQAIRNRAINHIKRNVFIENNLQNFLEYNGTEECGADDNSSDLRNAVRKAIMKVPPKSRRVLILNCIKNMKYKEIAEILDISVNTVKKHVIIGYRIMRQELADTHILLLVLFFLFFF